MTHPPHRIALFLFALALFAGCTGAGRAPSTPIPAYPGPGTWTPPAPAPTPAGDGATLGTRGTVPAYPGPAQRTGADGPEIGPDPHPLPAIPAYELFFPQIFTPPRPPAVLGYEIAHESKVPATLPQVEEIANVATVWTRQSLNWRQVEPTPGRYEWPAEMDRAVDLLRPHTRLILVLADIPAWALRYEEWPCGPMDPAFYAAFAQYAAAAVDRYQPDAVELWNEPDAPITQEAKGWGCWSVPGQEVESGREFGRAMLVAVEAIRKASPATLILSGGLLYGCNVEGAFGCPGADFLRGMQASGLLGQVDGMAFHSYAQWVGEDDPINTRYFMWKVTTIRKVIGGTPLWMTEGGYLCHPSAGEKCDTATFRQRQADYVIALADACHEAGTVACIWYSLSYNGWRHADMLGRDGPEPAYLSYLDSLRIETRRGRP